MDKFRNRSAKLLPETVEMVHGAVAVTDRIVGACTDRRVDIGFGTADRLGELVSVGQECRDGRRERAARAVGVGRRKALRAQFDRAVALGIVKDVD